MKLKTTLLNCAIFMSMMMNAQSFKFGTVAADAGLGLRIYGVRAYSPVNKTDIIGVFLGSTLPTVSAELGLAQFFGVGVRYGRGAYLQQGFKVRTNDFSICANFHVANRSEKFDLPITVAYGFSGFKADQTTTSSTPQYIHANGGVISLHVSPHFYFGEHIGMFLRLGYNKCLYKNIDYNDGSKNYTEADGGTWRMGGMEFCVGIAGKLDVLKKKEKENKN